MTFLSDEDEAVHRQHVRVTPQYTPQEIGRRSERKAAEELPRRLEEIRARYRRGETIVTFVFIEETGEQNAEILARSLARQIAAETGFQTTINSEASAVRASLTVMFAAQPLSHEQPHPPVKKGRGSTPRFVRWVIVVTMAITAVLLILFGMAAGYEGPDKDGEILVFSGVGMIMLLIVVSVLLFANDDSNHQDR